MAGATCIFPGRFAAFACQRISHRARSLGSGVLETFTIPLQPFDPWFFAHIPYVLAVVELEEQEDLKMVTNIVDAWSEDDLRCGMSVHVVFREVAEGLTLPLFALDGVQPTQVEAER